MGSISGLGGSPGGSHGIVAWQAIVHRVAKCRTQLKLLKQACTVDRSPPAKAGNMS